VNAKDQDANTPLDRAILKRHSETADLLLKHGGMTGAELALIPRLVQHGRFAFSFDAKKGKVYEVQDSFDLLNWEVIKTYTGTGDSVRFDEERDQVFPQIYYRVKVVE
jgi:ankyrin repeat protein